MDSETRNIIKIKTQIHIIFNSLVLLSYHLSWHGSISLSKKKKQIKKMTTLYKNKKVNYQTNLLLMILI